MPGTPPNTRRGLLKQSLLFGVEKQRQSVVIGPAESFIGTAMTAHEFGGIYRKRRYPKRPLMGRLWKRRFRNSRLSGKILSKNKEEIFYGYCTGP